MLALMLVAGCADEPFAYSLQVPLAGFAIEGHDGASLVELTLDSYDTARAERRLVVTRTEAGVTARRELEPSCDGPDVGTPLSEVVTISSTSIDGRIYIQPRSCSGTVGDVTIIDCGC